MIHSKIQMRVLALAALAGTALAVAACSAPVTTVNPAIAPPAQVQAQAAAVQQPATVNIEAGEFFIKPSQTTFKTGVPYHFVLRNTGKIPHEIMLMPVTRSASGMSMEQMDKMALGMVEQEDFPAGAPGSFDVTFDKAYGPGELEFACHIAGHYEAGMHTPITVTDK